MKKKVLAAMSGGVDSSAAAILLQEQGYEVVGATVKMFGNREATHIIQSVPRHSVGFREETSSKSRSEQSYGIGKVCI